ncbi:butyrophilin subfamily 3 member A2-like [Anoplopoma fimbria]|uniref:butyrophilin subfamily 3 member A2-like n=1 Tax=Anoplopoma fimbria TaxID=229290 RepID=UPI0023EC3547|nr:butyrophilin subfamily 3 member A2-like [Anoplopoma fimbria]
MAALQKGSAFPPYPNPYSSCLSQLIGPPQSIVALVGDDIILPCHMKPEMDVTAEPLEWRRPDLNPVLVHVMRAGRSLENVQHPSYKGRTSLSTDELKRGNISLRLSNVQLSDQGTYECDIPLWKIQSSVKLVVEAVSSAVITLAGMDRDKGGVVLDCESRGWYPEPEVLWLDAEGNLLSAGPTETVRGPDDLYTVSSRVTVEKRHSNSFTCRVQQKNTNQTRETHITVPDDFFKLQSCSSPIITGLAVSLAVCFLLLLIVVWRWRQNIKNMKSHSDETIKGEKSNGSKTTRAEDQFVTEEETKPLKDKEKTKDRREEEQKVDLLFSHFNLQSINTEVVIPRPDPHFFGKEGGEEAEKEVQTLKEELETKKNEVETKRAELQTLHEEKLRNETQLQKLKEELKNKQDRTQNSQSRFSFSGPSQQQLQQQKEVETLKKNLESQQEESNIHIKKSEDIEGEVQQLQDQIQRMEADLQKLMESNKRELERSREAPAESSTSLFQDEQQRRQKAEEEVQILKEKAEGQDGHG